MKTKKTVICTAIAAALLCTAIFSGCGNNNNHSSSNSSSDSNSNQSSVSKSNDSQKTNKKSLISIHISLTLAFDDGIKSLIFFK